MADTRNSDLQHGAGSLRRIWLRLNSPSVTWSVLTLLIVGIVTGVGCVIVARWSRRKAKATHSAAVPAIRCSELRRSMQRARITPTARACGWRVMSAIFHTTIRPSSRGSPQPAAAAAWRRSH